METQAAVGPCAETSDELNRWALVEEDLQWLVESGVREGAELARRLGFTNEHSFERFCYRHDIPLMHKKKDREVPFNARKIAARLYGREDTAPDPELAARARAVILRYCDDPSVLDVLDMLGLADSEQQLASAS